MAPPSVLLCCTGLLVASHGAGAQEPQLLRLSLLPGQVHTYCQGTDLKIHMEVAGKPVETAMTFEVTLETRVAGVKDGKADLDQTVRRLRVQVQNPRLQVDYDSDQPDAEGRSALLVGPVAAIVGKTFRMTLDERARISDVAVPSGVDAAIADALGGGDLGRFFAQNLPLLPERPLAVGRTWENKTAMALGQVGNVEVKVQSRLARIDGSKAVIEQVLLPDVARLGLPAGSSLEVQKAAGSTVLDLTGGVVVASETKLELRLKGQQGGFATDSNLVLTLRRHALDAQPEVEPAAGAGKDQD